MIDKIFPIRRDITFVQKDLIRGFLLILFSLAFGYILGSGGLFSELIVFILFSCLFVILFVIKANWLSILTFVLIMVPLYLHMIGSMSTYFQEIKNYLIPLIFIVLAIKSTGQKKMYEAGFFHNKFSIPLMLFFIVFVVNFIRNPVKGAIFGASVSEAGLSQYAGVLTSFLVFYIAWVSFSSTKNCEQFFKVTYHICIIGCILGLLMYFFEFQIPMLFSEHARKAILTPGGVKRIPPFSANLGLWGFLLLFNSVVPNPTKTKNFFLYILFASAILITGLRGSVIAAIIVFVIFLISKKKWVLCIAICLLSFLLWKNSEYFYTRIPSSIPAIQRLFKVSSLEVADIGRARTYEYSLEYFKQSPLLGQGIGYHEVYLGRGGAEQFAETQLQWSGGHGLYFSILYSIGILGFIPFMWLLIGGIFLAVRLYRYSSGNNTKKISSLIFMYLIAFIFQRFFTGNVSYLSDLFFMLGFLAAIDLKIQKSYTVKNLK